MNKVSLCVVQADVVVDVRKLWKMSQTGQNLSCEHKMAFISSNFCSLFAILAIGTNQFCHLGFHPRKKSYHLLFVSLKLYTISVIFVSDGVVRPNVFTL